MTIKEKDYFFGVPVPFSGKEVIPAMKFNTKGKINWTTETDVKLIALSSDEIHGREIILGPAGILGKAFAGTPENQEKTFIGKEINDKKFKQTMTTLKGKYGHTKRLHWEETK